MKYSEYIWEKCEQRAVEETDTMVEEIMMTEELFKDHMDFLWEENRKLEKNEK